MKKRLLSALIFLPPVFYAVEVGGLAFLFLLLVVSFFAFYEYYKALNILDKRVWIFTGLEILISYIAIFIGGVYPNSNNIISSSYLFQISLGILFIFFILVMAVYILDYPRIELKAIALIFLAQIYIFLPILSYAIIGCIYSNLSYFRWLVIAIAFLSDTSAMLSGMFFGKKKLMPKISPAKTRAGFYGSLIGTGVLLFAFSCTYAYFSRGSFTYIDKTIFLSLPVGVLGSLISQLGDLVASAIKRQAGIKDFGNIIPGHGGILDRLDSIIFTSIFVFILSMFY